MNRCASEPPDFNLAERHQGVTPAIGESFTEAARVCLGRHHQSPIAFTIEDSGTDKGTPKDVEVRLLQKVAQARAGQSNLPALATVVGFKAQKIAVKDVGEGA